MANEFGSITVDMLQSDENGDLLLEGNKARYSMKDSANPRMEVGGSITLDPIDPDDTVAEWWQKVKDQITTKDVADDAAFVAKMGEI